MAHTFPLTFAGSAVSDLQEMQKYYESEQTPETGKRLLAEIIGVVEQIAEFPLSGRVVPEFNVAYLREIIHPPFRIVYRCDRKRVRIIRVWRSERLLKLP